MPNKGRFMWNGVRSPDLGVIVTEQPDILRPQERLLATKNVPGRSRSMPTQTHLQDCAGRESSPNCRILLQMAHVDGTMNLSKATKCDEQCHGEREKLYVRDQNDVRSISLELAQLNKMELAAKGVR